MTKVFQLTSHHGWQNHIHVRPVPKSVLRGQFLWLASGSGSRCRVMCRFGVSEPVARPHGWIRRRPRLVRRGAVEDFGPSVMTATLQCSWGKTMTMAHGCLQPMKGNFHCRAFSRPGQPDISSVPRAFLPPVDWSCGSSTTRRRCCHWTFGPLMNRRCLPKKLTCGTAS